MANKVEIQIGARDETVAAIQRVQHNLGGLSSMLKGVGTTALGVATGFVGVSGLSGALGAVGEAAFGLNNRLQQASVGFTTMLGSAQASDAMLRDLSRFAATTPFEFPELVTATQRMLALGFSSRQVIPLLTDVGNAAAAMGTGTEGINRIILALGQMQSRTKVAAGEMLQLTEAGIPAWNILAQALGKSVAETQDLVSQGKVASAVFIQAFQDFSRNNFGEMMEKQSHTFTGAVSTIKDNLSGLVATGFRPVFDATTGILNAFADLTSHLLSALTPSAEKAADELSKLADTQKRAELQAQFLKTANTELEDGLARVRSAWQAFADELARAAETDPPVIRALKAALKESQKFEESQKRLTQLNDLLNQTWVDQNTLLAESEKGLKRTERAQEALGRVMVRGGDIVARLGDRYVVLPQRAETALSTLYSAFVQSFRQQDAAVREGAGRVWSTYNQQLLEKLESGTKLTGDDLVAFLAAALADMEKTTKAQVPAINAALDDIGTYTGGITLTIPDSAAVSTSVTRVNSALGTIGTYTGGVNVNLPAATDVGRSIVGINDALDNIGTYTGGVNVSLPSASDIGWSVSRINDELDNVGSYTGKITVDIPNPYDVRRSISQINDELDDIRSYSGGVNVNLPSSSTIRYQVNDINSELDKIHTSYTVTVSVPSAYSTRSQVSSLNTALDSYMLRYFDAIPAAQGALVTRPTLMLAGEAGPELILPLSGNRSGGGGGGTRSLAGFTPLQVIVNGPIYGFADFEDRIVAAVIEAQRRGRLT
jgi:tape measure domain-containing protein